MIDLKKAIDAFNEYRQNYPDTEIINLKVAHTKRVMKNCLHLAKSLKLSEEDTNLAVLIGLLHDIGRFEQAKIYNTFIDSRSINHAMFSSKQLFSNGLIRNFIEDDRYDSIIQVAIENHNKFEIDKSVTGKALEMSKIVRDADKIDIYVQVLESNPNIVFDGKHNKTDKISEKVFDDFMAHKCIQTSDMKCKSDDFVRKVALIYGLYYPESLEIILKQDLITKLSNHFKSSFDFSNPNSIFKIDMVTSMANSYMKSQVKSFSHPLNVNSRI